MELLVPVGEMQSEMAHQLETQMANKACTLTFKRHQIAVHSIPKGQLQFETLSK